MDIRLTPEDLELKERARDFTERVLIPLELECEEHDGLSAESSANAKRAVLDAGFNAINHGKDDGGQGFDLLQQILIVKEKPLHGI
jgi:butyryl-CoA dehydrogenase